MDEHYLAHSRPPQVDPAAYALGDAITDYWIEHGQRQTSFDSIRARLNLVVRFLAGEIETGRMEEPVCVDAITDDFLARFQAWALTDPITWKNRKGRVILTKQRSEATVNEAVRQLRAAVRHAWKRRRIASVPHIPVAKRGDVSAPTLERISVAQIAEMLDYAVASRRCQSLHRYLIAAVTTLARPEAICDMNLDPSRQQWDVEGRRFNLNPAGRRQTAKYRPTCPVGAQRLEHHARQARHAGALGAEAVVAFHGHASARSRCRSVEAQGSAVENFLQHTDGRIDGTGLNPGNRRI